MTLWSSEKRDHLVFISITRSCHFPDKAMIPSLISHYIKAIPKPSSQVLQASWAPLSGPPWGILTQLQPEDNWVWAPGPSSWWSGQFQVQRVLTGAASFDFSCGWGFLWCWSWLLRGHIPRSNLLRGRKQKLPGLLNPGLAWWHSCHPLIKTVTGGAHFSG